jgi:hypothetical protein
MSGWLARCLVAAALVLCAGNAFAAGAWTDCGGTALGYIPSVGPDPQKPCARWTSTAADDSDLFRLESGGGVWVYPGWSVIVRRVTPACQGTPTGCGAMCLTQGCTLDGTTGSVSVQLSYIALPPGRYFLDAQTSCTLGGGASCVAEIVRP